MTWIREPAERALSAFYHFKVSRGHKNATDENILEFLTEPNNRIERNHMMQYISSGESVSEIMRKYDFIGITDRFEESMLVLAHRLGLEMEDMLYIKAKDSHLLKRDNLGHHFVPSVPVKNQSHSVQRYLKEKWYGLNAVDYELWDKVNEQMDRQIAEIDGFDDKLYRYKALLETVQDQCGYLQNKRIDCLYGDAGCGQHCIDEVVKYGKRKSRTSKWKKYGKKKKRKTTQKPKKKKKRKRVKRTTKKIEDDSDDDGGDDSDKVKRRSKSKISHRTSARRKSRLNSDTDEAL